MVGRGDNQLVNQLMAKNIWQTFTSYFAPPFSDVPDELKDIARQRRPDLGRS